MKGWKPMGETIEGAMAENFRRQLNEGNRVADKQPIDVKKSKELFHKLLVEFGIITDPPN